MRFFLTLIVLLFTALPAQAQHPLIDQAEMYLQSLKYARARFLQTAPDGSRLTGTFYLNRPGRLRFEYDPPVQDFIVADGVFIYFYDADLQEQSHALIGDTLADFLLRDDLSLTGEVSVVDIQRQDRYLLYTLVKSDDPDAGTLTLGFVEDPFELKKWRVTDAQGLITETELFRIEYGIPLPDHLFSFHTPRPTGEDRYN